METLLPFQRQRERELWSRLRELQPSLADLDVQAERALAAGASPVAVLGEQVEPTAYGQVVAAWRRDPPEWLTWGPFQVGAEAGRGAHGVVYWARLGAAQVALKLLHDPGGERRFLREAELLRRLEHPNLVRLVAAGERDGAPYLATVAILGGSLLGLGPQPVRRALDLTLGVAAGLAHAHAAGVIHRDLKPSNVLLDDGQPRVVDFGLAAVQGGTALTGTRTLVGTLDHAAPEQLASARRVGPAADVYALGALLHSLLCGAPPWAGLAPLGRRLHAIQAGFPGLPAVAGLDASTRASLDALLALALAAQPAGRIGLADLSQALGDCRPTG